MNFTFSQGRLPGKLFQTELKLLSFKETEKCVTQSPNSGLKTLLGVKKIYFPSKSLHCFVFQLLQFILQIPQVCINRMFIVYPPQETFNVVKQILNLE